MDQNTKHQVVGRVAVACCALGLSGAPETGTLQNCTQKEPKKGHESAVLVGVAPIGLGSPWGPLTTIGINVL